MVELFSILPFKNKVAVHILEHIFGGQKHSFLLGVYCGQELLGHRIYVC